MTWTTIKNLDIRAEGAAIYANGINQMKITVQFDAYDENGAHITLDEATLRSNVWLIDYYATDADQKIEQNGWSVSGSASAYYNYPPVSGAERLPVIDQLDDTEGPSQVVFYIATSNFVSGNVQIGCVIKTEANVYTCSQAKLGNQAQSTKDATFMLLKDIHYTMDNCAVTIDSESINTPYQNGWIHYLTIQDPTGDRNISSMDVKNGSDTLLVAVDWTDRDIVNWWHLEIDNSHCGHWSFIFPFTAKEGEWEFWFNNIDMCGMPYNKNGNSITMVHYWHDKGVDARCASGDEDLDAPIFVISDQYGNSGQFTIVGGDYADGWLKYISN